MGCADEFAHFKKHFVPNSDEHLLFANLNTRNVFCVACNTLMTMESALYCGGKLQNMHSAAPLKTTAASAFALTPKGLINLGSTCFINVILQVLLNTPPIIRAFSEPCGSTQMCRMHRSSAKGAFLQPEVESSCMTCDFDALFVQYAAEAAHAENLALNRPLSPHPMLKSLWSSSKALAGYTQQDAHEFFISLLNDMHRHFARNNSPAADCRCLVHASFGGELQSVVTCETCNSKSSTIDPFFDLSLETTESAELADSFAMFTKKETLPENTYFCNTCRTYRLSCYKEMFIRKLPAILVIHLKRFGKNFGSKIRVPLCLDVGAFVSAAKNETNDPNEEQFAKRPPAPQSQLYSLYAAVSHYGVSGDAGHYVAFVKRHETLNEWLRLDDAFVARVPPSQLKDGAFLDGAYLLFYAKH